MLVSIIEITAKKVAFNEHWVRYGSNKYNYDWIMSHYNELVNGKLPDDLGVVWLLEDFPIEDVIENMADLKRNIELAFKEICEEE